MNAADCIRQFDRLTSALIDTASLIYLDRIQCLDRAARALELLVIPEVAAEYGSGVFPSGIIRIPGPGDTEFAKTTDDRLLETARGRNLPIISEDKRVLKQAGQTGLPYFNTLMLLNFMFYTGALNAGAYEMFVSRLKPLARYSPWIYEFSGQVYELIRSRMRPPHKPGS